MQIKIIQREDYDFPQPSYAFGQTVIDHQGDEGFIVAMRFTSDSWEYQLWYTKLEVLSPAWVYQNTLSSCVVDI